ncbi:hypothetical protein [Dongia deserti]|uniref:hypothetical protein n=1 Tax=Dongia deserti TaxID=2268030 RepID=UPI0013C47781|nr:hypothetical protein [Dongia deserti]
MTVRVSLFTDGGMIALFDYAILGLFAVLFVLILLAVREAGNSKSRIARVHPLWYLWRRGPWWTRTVTLLTLFALLFGLTLLSKHLAS